MTLIVVNAVASAKGGGATILRQFLSSLDEESYYHVFVSDLSVLDGVLPRGNVVVHPVGEKKLASRLWWDYVGLGLFLRGNDIVPNLVVSMQNTPSYIWHDVPQVVYLHQAIPISDFRFSFFSKMERSLWFYKTLYPIFMRGFPSRRRVYVCQATWMRVPFSNLLRVPLENVRVYRPNAGLMDVCELREIDAESREAFFVYPAASHIYKNHTVLVGAAALLKNSSPQFYRSLRILLTIEPGDPTVVPLIDAAGVLDAFEFVGHLPHNKLMALLSKPSCVMLFPSRIETIGLPLIEASYSGCFILAADLPYSKEVLRGYRRVRFVCATDPQRWADEMVASGASEGFVERNGCDSGDNDEMGWVEFVSFLNRFAKVD